MILRRSFAVFLFLACCVCAAAAQTWTPEMQVRLRAVGSPDVSPDGRYVVYTVNDPVMTADKSEFVTQIWLATTDGRENRQITFGEKSSTNPKFSPDGSMIAFSSNRRDNRNQIYVLRLAGGEAEQITEGKTPAGNFKWSPDGKWIAYTMSDAKTPEEEANDKGRNDFRWFEENYKLAGLYVIPLAKGANGKREPKRLTGDNRHVTTFDWAPDSSRIAFAHVKSPSVDAWPSSDISVVEVSTATVKPFVATADFEGGPRYSPDGKWIAVSTSDGPPRWAQSDRLVLHPTAAGSPKPMPLSFDAGPNVIAWTPDSKR